LRDHIRVKLKTFYGRRSTFHLEMSINDKLSDMIPKICIEEDSISPTDKKFNYANQYRLVSSRGRIKELNSTRTFAEEGINDNEALIMINPVSLSFSDIYKGHLIYLDSKNKAALKQGGDEPQFVLADHGYSCGKNYCEFILETEPYERSVIIGVTLKRSEYSLSSSDIKGFWGYVLSDGKKVQNSTSNKLEMIEYGDITKIGDRIGIMIEYNASGVDISFFVNKINLGIAFKSLPAATYFPCAVLGFDGTRIRITNKVSFPDL
jgi:hypothetical protein